MWFNGLLDLSAWQLIAVTLVMTHITIVNVTLYLHRHSAHNALDLNPVLKHFFRFWLWLTTAQNTKEWTAIHRKHHAKCETEEDPHRSEEHTSELQSRPHLVCRLLLEKKKKKNNQ